MNAGYSISRAKLKAANQEERLQNWNEHFENLPGNSPEITNKPIQKIANDQREAKLGQFKEEGLDSV